MRTNLANWFIISLTWNAENIRSYEILGNTSEGCSTFLNSSVPLGGKITMKEVGALLKTKAVFRQEPQIINIYAAICEPSFPGTFSFHQ